MLSKIYAYCEKVFTVFLEKWPQVNNAGVSIYKPFLEMSMQEYDDVMNTNLRAPFRLTQLCLPHLIKTKGIIIDILHIWKNV